MPKINEMQKKTQPHLLRILLGGFFLRQELLHLFDRALVNDVDFFSHLFTCSVDSCAKELR